MGSRMPGSTTRGAVRHPQWILPAPSQLPPGRQRGMGLDLTAQLLPGLHVSPGLALVSPLHHSEVTRPWVAVGATKTKHRQKHNHTQEDTGREENCFARGGGGAQKPICPTPPPRPPWSPCREGGLG